MLRQISDFFNRIFRSKAFRVTLRVVLGFVLFSYIFNIIYALVILTNSGIPFSAALQFVLEYLLGIPDRIFSLSGVGAGIVLGLIWFFYRRWRNRVAAEEEDGEEAAEEAKKEESAPAPVQEEVIIETKHYTFH